MKFAFSAALCGALVAYAVVPAVAQSQGKPMRHLVYGFDVTITTEQTAHSSGIGAGGGGTGSGIDHYSAGNSDKGTITLDVLGVQPDTGLVVRISEQGRGDRSAEPAMCVAYGMGSVVCENKKINQEEMALLRVIGRNFINPSVMDTKKHWQTTESMQGGNETNDYTVASENAAGIMSIDYLRVLKVEGAGGYRADTTGNLTYNEKLTVPQQLKEDTVTRVNQGAGQESRTEQQLTLTLSTDSLTQTP